MGQTGSSDFPTHAALQATFGGGGTDAFVARLKADGSELRYSTYLGGSSQDNPFGAGAVAVDAFGSAYVAGATFSGPFPTLNPILPIPADGFNVFVAKLNPAGTALIYSTLLGGNTNSEFGHDIAVDASGSAYVTGYTNSADFLTLNAWQPGYAGNGDAFVSKLSPDGSALVYSTYLGGSGIFPPGGVNEVGNSIAVDPSGSAYVTGGGADGFPTANPLQPLFQGAADVILAKIGDPPPVDACAAISGLIAQIQAANLPPGTETSLLAKLNAACASFDRGNPGAAVNQLHAFLHAV